MEAPKGRYRVVEKDGRLVVIDNETGAPLPSSVAPPPRQGRSGPSPVSPVAPAGPGAIDRAADALLALVTREWDPEGRAVIAWEWRESGKVRRWDAALDPGQQRRMGRALLALVAAPLFLVLLAFADGALLGLGLLVAFPPVAWGALSLRRLYRETNDSKRLGTAGPPS